MQRNSTFHDNYMPQLLHHVYHTVHSGAVLRDEFKPSHERSENSHAALNLPNHPLAYHQRPPLAARFSRFRANTRFRQISPKVWRLLRRWNDIVARSRDDNFIEDSPVGSIGPGYVYLIHNPAQSQARASYKQITRRDSDIKLPSQPPYSLSLSVSTRQSPIDRRRLFEEALSLKSPASRFD